MTNDAAPAPSASDGAQVHFEEYVSKSASDLHPVHLGVGLFVAVLVGGALWVGVRDGILAAFGVATAVTVLIGLVLYTAFGRGVRVRVTGAGVEVRPGGFYLTGASGVTVPFEEISRVQYNDPDGRFIYPRKEERLDGAELYRVAHDGTGSDMRTHPNGVRIERADDPPVYVGSNRHVEMAEAIAERSPAVDSAEQFTPDGRGRS